MRRLPDPLKCKSYTDTQVASACRRPKCGEQYKNKIQEILKSWNTELAVGIWRFEGCDVAIDTFHIEGLRPIYRCLSGHISQQVALLLQRDRARHLSVEILQLHNISIEKHYRVALFAWFYVYSLWHNTGMGQTHTQTDRRTDTRRWHIPHLA